MDESPTSRPHPAPPRSTAAMARRPMVPFGTALAATCLLGQLLPGQAAAQGTPNVPPTAPPAAAATDSAAPRGGAGATAPGRFMDGVNNGFFGNLGAPPPPALNAIRGVKLPEAASDPEPTPSATAKPEPPKPATEASAATAAPAEPPRTGAQSAPAAKADKPPSAEPGSPPALSPDAATRNPG